VDFRRAEYTGADHANSVGIGPIELWIFVKLASPRGCESWFREGGVEPKDPEVAAACPATSGNIRFQLVLPDQALAPEHLDSRADQAVPGWEERKVLQVSAGQSRHLG